MSDCGCHIEVTNREQRSVLIALLAINGLMFVVEIVLGILSESTALIADSMDMLADAAVYGVGLYAVGRSVATKIRVAQLSGILEITLGVVVLIDILRRFIWGSEPQSMFMMAVGLAALVANLVCLKLISKHRDGEVHMRASWIFSKNDVIANLGVILAGVLVYMLDSRLPDLIIGVLVSLVVIRGGLFIIKDAKNEARADLATKPVPIS